MLLIADAFGQAAGYFVEHRQQLRILQEVQRGSQFPGRLRPQSVLSLERFFFVACYAIPDPLGFAGGRDSFASELPT